MVPSLTFGVKEYLPQPVHEGLLPLSEILHVESMLSSSFCLPGQLCAQSLNICSEYLFDLGHVRCGNLLGKLLRPLLTLVNDSLLNPQDVRPEQQGQN